MVSSVGLNIFVAVAMTGSGNLTAYPIATAFDAATILLAISFVVALVTIMLPRKVNDAPDPLNSREAGPKTGEAPKTLCAAEAI